MKSIRTFRDSIVMKTGNQLFRAHFNDDNSYRLLTGNLNAKVMVRSLSTTFLNDLEIMKGRGIAYDPNKHETAMADAKKEMDEFLADAFSKIISLKARANHRGRNAMI